MEGLSSKEIEIVSYLELNERSFFTRKEILRFFKNENDLGVYLHRLKKKGRILKLTKEKYYLIPVRAFRGHWSEHPFIIIDEMFDGKDYVIRGMAAAHYWGLIEQIPTTIEVQCMNRQGERTIFNFTIIFKRTRKNGLQRAVIRKVKGHSFRIAPREDVMEWLNSRG
jgi:predicted transcriptional regulator of viral defense system